MNDGKKRQSSAELPAHKRFAKSRSRWFRVNGIRLFSQSGYRFALLASFLFPFVTPLKPWFSMPHIA